MPLQIADAVNSPLWHSIHIFVKVKYFHLGKVSKGSSESDLWNYLKLSADKNVEYNPATDVNTFAKHCATFTDFKRTTKQHHVCKHTRYVITIE